jgi:hypothetical protein
MVKMLLGLVTAIAIALGSFFGFEFYVQHRVAAEVEAAFEQIRATGSKASHGKVSYDLLSRTITVADIAAESATQPPVSVKIASFMASGVGQPGATRFCADSIEAADVEVDGRMAAQTGWGMIYKVPRVAIKDYSGPAGPQRLPVSSSATDVSRFVLEHFAAVTAASVTVPSLAATYSVPGAVGAPQVVDYTYSNLALLNIKDGRIAEMTVGRETFTINLPQNGKIEEVGGEIASMASYDFDSGAVLAALDPARANDGNYYRAYRQATMGAYTVRLQNGTRVRIDGMTVDDIGLRPSKLQFPQLMAIVESMSPGVTRTPPQARDIVQRLASTYEGVHIGNAEMRGLAIETPQGPFQIGTIHFNLENGKIDELALEGLDGRSPKGPVKVGRFALKSLDVANLLRMSSQFSNPVQKPSPDQLLGLFLLLEGAEIKNVVAPYKDSIAQVNIEDLSLNWGQFVGPIPSKAHLTAKMSGPIDATDPALKILVTAGMSSVTMNVDLGAAWTEGSRTFVLEPVMVELGSLLSASARVSLVNVPREVFSMNPLQMAVMATQIEAGTIEITLRDLGGVDLAVAQYARTQNLTPDAARRAITESLRGTGATMATTNPDAMAITDALIRFIEDPRGTLTVKLTPQGKVPAMQLVSALKTDPLAALERFQVEASTGR